MPTVVAPYARRTDRLKSIQRQVAFDLGGEPGSRLLTQLGMPASADTLLRLIRDAKEPDISTPRVLGVDDWAKRKGHSYGTILVDLETHRPVDLLPSRTAESLANWLCEHPGVEIISRDRSGEYRKGATDGAPDATQVADRWHLLKNLRETFERLLENKGHCLTAAAENVPDEPSIAEKPPPETRPVDTPPVSVTPARPPVSQMSDVKAERLLEDAGDSVKATTAAPDQLADRENTPTSTASSSTAQQQPKTLDDKPTPEVPLKLTVAQQKQRAVHARRSQRYQMVCSLHQQVLDSRVAEVFHSGRLRAEHISTTGR